MVLKNVACVQYLRIIIINNGMDLKINIQSNKFNFVIYDIDIYYLLFIVTGELFV